MLLRIDHIHSGIGLEEWRDTGFIHQWQLEKHCLVHEGLGAPKKVYVLWYCGNNQDSAGLVVVVYDR